MKRLDGLDLLKSICALLVVCIHAPVSGEIGNCLTAISRIAVPIFLMISGYFYNNHTTIDEDYAQIKRILYLVVFSNLVYLLFNIVISIIKSGFSGLYNYFQTTLTVKNAITMFLLNESPFGGHLWYLGCVLYVLLIYSISKKYIRNYKNVFYFITPILLIVDLVLGKYSILIFGKELVPYIVLRNFMFVGIPYFTIGVFISSNTSTITDWKMKSLKTKIGLSLTIFFLYVLEFCFTYSNNLIGVRDHYINTTLLSISLFFLFLDNEWNKTNKYNLAKLIGRHFSQYIYIYHPLFIVFLNKFFVRFKLLENFYSLFKPIIIFSVTFIILYIISFFQNRIKTRNNSLY